MSKVTDTLRAAVELLEIYGWCQGSLGNTSIGFCAVGAINAASRGLAHSPLDKQQRHGKACERLFSAINGHTHRYGVASWNDDPDRTKDEVLEAFRRAIEVEEAEP